ncbi:hypothetical protein GQ457_16G002800 [Hibiscus cannabinus]
MAKKVAEAERLIKKGIEYCQNKRRVSQSDKDLRIFCSSLRGGWPLAGVDLRYWSQRSAPRRMAALVAPQIRPTANIFSTSPIILFLTAEGTIGIKLCDSLHIFTVN